MYGYNNYGNNYMPQRPMFNVPQETEPLCPFQIVRFVNEKEAQGFTLLPNQKALLMDTANMKFWIKWTDSLGNSTIETYKFEKSDNAEKVPAIDTSKFITHDDIKNLPTRAEMDSLKETIADLKKQIKISQIMNDKKGE